MVERKQISTNIEGALHYYILANRLQRKYGDGARWRFVRGILGRVRRLYRKAKNIVEHRTSLVPTIIVRRLAESGAGIIMEDLRGLKLNAFGKAPKRWRAELNLLAYRKLQRRVE